MPDLVSIVVVLTSGIGTHLCLPLPPKASSTSESGDSALGTHPSSGEDGNVFSFGKKVPECRQVYRKTHPDS